MAPDLASLVLPSFDAHGLSGLHTSTDYFLFTARGNRGVHASVAVGVALVVGFFILVLSRRGGVSLASIVITAGLCYGGARALRVRARRARGLDVLETFHAKIERFNTLVRALDVTDRLRYAHGKPVDPMARSEALRALAIARENLVRTLMVERLLRENRWLLADVGLAGAGVDLVPVEALRVQGEATEYARVVAETIELAVGIQRSFEGLQRDEHDDQGGREPTGGRA